MGKAENGSGGGLRSRVVRILAASVIGSMVVLAPAYLAINRRAVFVDLWLLAYDSPEPNLLIASPKGGDDLAELLVEGALARLDHNVVYPPPSRQYREIDYPMGDVPDDEGVCTDLVIRAYRRMDIDLQEEVHEDMKGDFWRYPPLWGLLEPDPNIDHRRVPNLMVFFSRRGKRLPLSDDPEDYRPGDVVCWELAPGITHIGIVSDQRDKHTGNPKIIHNIGLGPDHEDVLFDYEIIGHFRYPAHECAMQ